MSIIPIKIVFEKVQINFVKYFKLFIALSIIFSALSLFLVFTKGFNLGTDFKGGSLIEIRVATKDADIPKIRKNLSEANLGEVQIQTIKNDDINFTDIIINIGAKKNEVSNVDKIKEVLQASILSNIEYRKVDFVGPNVTEEVIYYGVLAVIFSLIGIFIYIWVRFDVLYACGGILALFHDLILTLGFYSLTGFEFSSATVAAILTILGYSINDSVIIYDRLRLNLRKFKSKGLDEVINTSINTTLNRTIMTSMTTLIAVIVIHIFGGEALKSFSAGLIFGILIGTYSSIFISAPFLILKKK